MLEWFIITSANEVLLFSWLSVCYFAKILKSILLSLFFFVYLQHNSETTAQMVLKFLGSIRTVTRKNWLKFRHNQVNILDSGAYFYWIHPQLLPWALMWAWVKSMRSFSLMPCAKILQSLVLAFFFDCYQDCYYTCSKIIFFWWQK